MPYFLCRLNPPRPSFASDMTEAALMARHAGHLRDCAAKGTLLIAGPVADPAGPWGLGVFRADSEAQMRVLTGTDPVIRADAGFSYDIYPMLSAIVGRPNLQET